MFTKFIAGVKKLASGWLKSMKSVFRTESRLAINDFSKKFGLKPRETTSLIESFNSGKMLLTEAKESINEKLQNASKKRYRGFCR